MANPSDLRLEDGARVAVVGGGPAGSFFGYFLRQMAHRLGRRIEVDIYEPRDFSCAGPKGCNMCGGVVSESLMQNLATEGIHLPPTVIQRRINAYVLHMDVGSVRIATPLQEMRIAAVARGSGPRGIAEPQDSFDAFLLGLAIEQGCNRVHERVTGVSMEGERPRVETAAGPGAEYDLLVGAVGVNSSFLRSMQGLQSFEPPGLTRAYVAEFEIGEQMIERYLSNAMHVFLLNLPRLDFAALIPKSDFVTVCLLGDDIDKELIDGFLDAKEVKEVLPPHWRPPSQFCHCSPRLNVEAARHTFGDRLVFIGDCGTTRLFKDGIGAAYRTAKAAAKTALFRGIGVDDFRRGFLPTCRSIDRDNRLGRFVFSATRQVQKRHSARRALWRVTSREQSLQGDKRRMSKILWDTFTGSAPYGTILRRASNPMLAGRFLWELAAGLRSGDTIRPAGHATFASGETGLRSIACKAGQVIYRQGEHEDCMYVLGGCEVELVRHQGDGDHRIAVVGSGDFVGEMALFGEQERPATARVLRDGYLYKLKRQHLLQRVHEDPPMAFRLVQHFAGRIAKLEDSLVRSGAFPASVQLLLHASSTAGAEGVGISANGLDAAGRMGRRFAAGEVVYHQGERGDCMYVLNGGAVEGVRREGDEEFCLAVLRKGDFFGEAALFDQETRTATVRALEDVHVLTLERHSLLRRLHEDPSAAMQLIEAMARRVAALEERELHALVPGASTDSEHGA